VTPHGVVDHLPFHTFRASFRVCGGKALNSKSLAVTRLPSAEMTARCTRCCNSGTFADQR
jgi:hypothetical protein